ncbi:ADP-ribosylation factor-like protein 13B [Mercenaria mercenaria]|uniref:ADP-ribosylation factor-like protein 13B n=1 Tax=Mercenaria mercenaria TaxID=6596 RepID=UPI00234EF055|nr:ADP-ribosylation factor-like protein 13B [Mercenaria mercenaria]
MGNCISCIKQKRQPKRSVKLAILGLDSAGKTTTTKALLGDTLDVAPTVGFNREEITFNNYDISLYDLGGGRKIRDIWKNYLNEIYGVIYVVDTAAPERFQEVQEILTSLLGHEQVKEKPFLLLGNKVDLESHVDEVDVMEKLNLEYLVNVNKCPSRLEMCSAIKGSGRKMDPKIKDGMTWLCSLLDQMYEKLKLRIDKDVEVMEQIRQKEKEERRERVRKVREEREKKEEEERKKLGEDIVEEEDEDDDIVGGNPWKKLDSDEIKRKEEKYKQAKAKEKERQRRLKEIENQEKSTKVTLNEQSNTTTKVTADDDDDGLRAPRSSRSLLGLGWMNGGLYGTEEEGSNSHRLGRQLLPPLEGLTNGKTADSSPVSSDRGKKPNKKLKNKVQSYDGADYDNGRNIDAHRTSSVSRIQVESVHRDDDEDEDTDSVIHSSGRRDIFRKSRGLYIDEGKHKQESPDSGRKKKTRKKKQQLSSDGEEGFDTLRLSQHLDNDTDTYASHMNGARDSPDGRLANGDTEERASTPVKKLKKKNKHLRKNKLAPSDDEFEAVTPTNWGMAEDLSADEIQQFRRPGPNFDSEDDLIL